MRRSALAVVPFLAVPFAAAACGGGGKSASPPAAALPDDPFAAVTGAARKTTESSGERVKLAGRIVSGGQSVVFTGSGQVDNKAHRGSFSADVSGSGISTALDEVSQGAVVYVKADLLTAMLPAGKTWLKLDPAKTDKAAGAGLSSLLSQDPVQTLTKLQSLRDVTKVGRAQLDGVTTTHYRGRVDLSVLTGTSMVGTGRYDVWIGDDGYVHRVKAIVAKGGTVSTVTADLSAFDEAVSVTVPAASETETYNGKNFMIPGLGG
jgi:LppX/LprAFG-like lipoprotein